MLFPALILFFLFLLLSAFFSSSETSFIVASPYKLDYLEKKGSRRAELVKRLLKKADNLLATILIGNTLVNAAAASVATFIFVSLIQNKNHAILFATLTTTILILILSEITPKTYAAYNPIKISFLFVQPIRFFVIIFFPFVKAFTFISSLIFPSSIKKRSGFSRSLNEEEIKVLLTKGIKGMSSLRKKMISGVLDIASRPVSEIMIPRPQVRAIEIKSSKQQILEMILSDGFSRFPVYRGRLDNIEGVIHAKDIIPYLVDNKEFNIRNILRKPFFIPESASLEKTLLQMQETTNHLVFIVDEFGNMEGIVTLEDIIEEIVGEIRDEYDLKEEDLIIQIEENVYAIKGRTSVKDINQRLALSIPEKRQYSTLAGFLLSEFGKIPRESEILNYKNYKFVVEKMIKRHINLIRLILEPEKDEPKDENHRQE
ncbi:MAG: HlyC/CorC family transporter [Candidatus Aminicenantes bacterium]|nr:HlyC/CorC family transporter [Candidatus Aminicenantes bacterium]MBL7082264.1 HlyC/CorC family transporter [Candidatus Aminicenantes bacterium]